MTFLYGRAGRLNTENAGFRPGQTSTAVFGAAEMPEVRVMCLAYLSLQQSGREREGEREQRERESSERVR
jgi:hypothetical protein